MKIKKVKVSELVLNKENPRIIKDSKFKNLVNSIKSFPAMLEIRPIVVNADMVILGGNMRYQAAIEAGYKDIPVIIADELTEQEQNEFIIKDNMEYGDWNWDLLANEWDNDTLKDWGLIQFEFNPNITPTAKKTEMTEEILAKTEERLQETPTFVNKYIDVICPDCATEFKITL